MYLLLLDSVPMVSRSANGSLKRLDVYSMTSFKTHQRDSDTVLIQGTCREGEKICHGCHQFIFDFSCTRKTLIMFPCLNSIYVHSNTQDIKKKKKILAFLGATEFSEAWLLRLVPWYHYIPLQNLERLQNQH